jgi:hypothetical protein
LAEITDIESFVSVNDYYLQECDARQFFAHTLLCCTPFDVRKVQTAMLDCHCALKQFPVSSDAISAEYLDLWLGHASKRQVLPKGSRRAF